MSRYRRFVAVVSVVATLGLLASLTTLSPSRASSHREAQLISEDPVADNTDTYVFRSPDRPDTVTIVGNWIPLEEPAGGPNFNKFGDDVKYTLNVDNDGDAVDDIVYEFRFRTQIQNRNTFLYNTGPITSLNDPDFNIRQSYSIAKVEHGNRQMVASGLATPPVNIGPRSTPGYEALAAQAVASLKGGGKVFAGQRDDPFFVDLGSVFDLLGLRPLNQAHLIKQPTARGVDGVGGYNTHSIVLQVPITELTHDHQPLTGPKDPDAVIGVYAASERRQVKVLSSTGDQPRTFGSWVRVSRLGMPLVNEVVIPLGKKDRFNASDPADDAQFGNFVLDPEPARLIPVLYPGVKVPAAPRNDIATIFLTGIPGLNQPANVKPSEMIRLNMGIPATPPDKQDPLGLLAGQMDGFPNGRRLADDVTDIELRALAGGTPFTPDFNKAPNNLLTDGVQANDKPFLASFPYLATPHQGYDHTHHPLGS
ncbi:MAG TPA: DUF4331 domain-containing protein [Actinomycetes bacterium]